MGESKDRQRHLGKYNVKGLSESQASQPAPSMVLSSFNHLQMIIALPTIQQDPELSIRTAA